MHRAWTPELAYLAQYTHALRTRLALLLPRDEPDKQLIVDHPELSSSPALPIGELALELSLDALDRDLLMFAAATRADPTLAPLLAAASAPYGLPYACGYTWLRLGGLANPSFVWTQQFRLDPQRTLRRRALIEVVDHGANNPLLAELFVSSDIVSRLRGERFIDERIAAVAQLHEVVEPLPPPPWPEQCLDELRSLFVGHRLERQAALPQPEAPTVRATGIILWGPKGLGKRGAVHSLCHQLGLPLLELRAPSVKLEPQPARLLWLAVRQAALHGEVLLLEEADRVCTPDSTEAIALLHALERFPALLVLTAAHPERLDPSLREAMLGHVQARLDGHEARVAAWDIAFAQLGLISVPAHEAARRFPLDPGRIAQSARLARLRSLAQLSGDDPRHIEAVEVNSQMLEGCVWAQLGLESPHQDGQPALEELILAQPCQLQLLALRDAAKAQLRVFDAWGMGREPQRSSALLALFDGIPGTGKRTAARALARALGRPLVRLDDDQLRRALQQGDEPLRERYPALSLLLVERAEHLLEELDESDGERLRQLASDRALLVFVSNSPQTLNRSRLRSDFRVHFPVPDADARARLWQALIPSSTPVLGELDFEALGAEFTLAAAAIRRAILAACFASLEQGGIQQEQLYAAARREQDEARMTR